MSRWRLLAGRIDLPVPTQAPGLRHAIAAFGSDAYLVARDRLWRATVPACWRRCWWAPWGCAT